MIAKGIRSEMSMKNYRPIIAALLGLLFYTCTDILVWQRVFETNNMVNFADLYHAGWFVSLAGYATVGVFSMWGAWKDCLFFLTSLLVSAFSGLEDLLYYVLDGKPIPETLPWLSHNPMIYQSSRAGLIMSAAFWMVVLIILYFMLYQRRTIRNSVL